MSDDKHTPKNQPIDLSELANLEFSTAWSPSTNTGKFEPRGEGGRPFKKREFRDRADGEFKKREFRRPSDRDFSKSDRRPRRPDGRGEGRPGERQQGQKGGFRKPPLKKAPFAFTMEVLFYPEDAPFAKLADVMKHLKRTYQLFDIAELVLEKPERFVILAKNLPETDGITKPLYCAQPMNLPFETEEEAKKCAVDHWMGELFEKAEVEAEAPKGAFQVVNRCSLSGDLLGAPNWHKYGEYIREYHAQKYPNMPYEKFLASIETVRDEEKIAEWLELMKKREVYRLKDAETVFETRESACAYIVEQKGGELVKTYEQVRMHGADISKLPFSSRIRRNLEAAWSKQKRFPIITANNLRGRLRRAGFTIYKRGSKGFAFVSAVKRKFLLEGDSLSDLPQKIFDFITANQAVKAADLPYLYLGLKAPKGVSKAAPLAEEHKKQSEGGEVSAPVALEPVPELSQETVSKLKDVSNELLWLISEGYVVEYADSTLQANPRLPRPKERSSKTIASDAESIVLGVEDEPIISEKPRQSGVEETDAAEAENVQIQAEGEPEIAPDVPSVDEGEAYVEEKSEATSVIEPEEKKDE